MISGRSQASLGELDGEGSGSPIEGRRLGSSTSTWQKWEVGSGWTMLVNQILHHRNQFPPVFMLKINPSDLGGSWLTAYRVLLRAFGGCRCEGLVMLWLMTVLARVYAGHFWTYLWCGSKLQLWYTMLQQSYDNEYNPLDSTHSHERLVGPRHSQRSTTTWLATATINLLLGQSTISNFTNTEKTI